MTGSVISKHVHRSLVEPIPNEEVRVLRVGCIGWIDNLLNSALQNSSRRAANISPETFGQDEPGFAHGIWLLLESRLPLRTSMTRIKPVTPGELLRLSARISTGV